MYLTINPLRRLYPPISDQPEFAAEVLALLTSCTGTLPVQSWTGVQLGSSTGMIAALWPDVGVAEQAAASDGTTTHGVVLETGRSRPVQWAELVHGAVHPGVLQLTCFNGPRGEVYRLVDELSDRRITPAVARVPGIVAAIAARSADGGRDVLTLADTEATFLAALDAILGTELLPGEDPALLTGPSAVHVYRLAAGTALQPGAILPRPVPEELPR